MTRMPRLKEAIHIYFVVAIVCFDSFRWESGRNGLYQFPEVVSESSPFFIWRLASDSPHRNYAGSNVSEIQIKTIFYETPFVSGYLVQPTSRSIIAGLGLHM